jgi:F-box/WD-40 domain protein 7
MKHVCDMHALPPLTAGDLISGSKDGLVKIWNVHTLQLEGSMAGHSACVHAIFAAGQGIAFSGSEDLTIRRWDTYALTCTHVVMGHASCVCALHVAGLFLYSGSWNGTVRVWSAADLQFLEVRIAASTLHAPRSMCTLMRCLRALAFF